MYTGVTKGRESVEPERCNGVSKKPAKKQHKHSESFVRNLCRCRFAVIVAVYHYIVFPQRSLVLTHKLLDLSNQHFQFPFLYDESSCMCDDRRTRDGQWQEASRPSFIEVRV